jgi:hypothetical protein
MRPRKRSLMIGTAGLTAGLVAGGVTIAQAAIPSANNTITGCSTTSGPLRLIDTDAGQKCNTGETTVSWGGGMRFRGVWKDGPGPGVPPAGLYDSTKKGDVIRIEVPPNKFGCTTPKGSWVNVVGSYAYPCLEFPQNWAPLALDGPQGSNANAHWVSLTATGSVRASSDAGIITYPGTGYAYVKIPTVPDPSKCGLSATLTTYTSRVTAAAQVYADYVLVTTRDITSGNFTAATVDLTVTCAKYS